MTDSARPRPSAPRGVLSLMLVALLAVGLLGMHALSGVALPSTMPASAHGAVIAHAAVSASPHHAAAGMPEQVAPEAHPAAPHGGHPLAVSASPHHAAAGMPEQVAPEAHRRRRTAGTPSPSAPPMWTATA